MIPEGREASHPYECLCGKVQLWIEVSRSEFTPSFHPYRDAQLFGALANALMSANISAGKQKHCKRVCKTASPNAGCDASRYPTAQVCRFDGEKRCSVAF
jgi:hypothetical protein